MTLPQNGFQRLIGNQPLIHSAVSVSMQERVRYDGRTCIPALFILPTSQSLHSDFPRTKSSAVSPAFATTTSSSKPRYVPLRDNSHLATNHFPTGHVMGAFFVSWDLWQGMTFVLGCCILIVCGIGLARLWWTNRSLRKLAVMDEEKRSRLSEMRYCGMTARGIDEIPFGIRALQRGVEVEGVWIYRPGTPKTSKITSTTTLVANSQDLSNPNRQALSEKEGVQAFGSDGTTHSAFHDADSRYAILDRLPHIDSIQASSKHDGAQAYRRSAPRQEGMAYGVRSYAPKRNLSKGKKPEQWPTPDNELGRASKGKMPVEGSLKHGLCQPTRQLGSQGALPARMDQLSTFSSRGSRVYPRENIDPQDRSQKDASVQNTNHNGHQQSPSTVHHARKLQKRTLNP